MTHWTSIAWRRLFSWSNRLEKQVCSVPSIGCMLEFVLPPPPDAPFALLAPRRRTPPCFPPPLPRIDGATMACKGKPRRPGASATQRMFLTYWRGTWLAKHIFCYTATNLWHARLLWFERCRGTVWRGGLPAITEVYLAAARTPGKDFWEIVGSWGGSVFGNISSSYKI